jgi:hypothetical protein
MINHTQDWLAPTPLWDLVLRLAPLHVFVFDAGLVCRYAAPLDGTFLGQPGERCLNRHASEFLPPATDGLGSALEGVLQEGAPWRTDHYRYSHRVGDAETVYTWAIEATPIQAPPHRGILLTLTDVLQLVEERDRLRLQCEDLQDIAEQLRHQQTERDRVLTATATHMRTLLTPVWGYLELILRSHEFRTEAALRSVLAGTVLPQLHELLDLVRGLENLPAAEPREP